MNPNTGGCWLHRAVACLALAALAAGCTEQPGHLRQGYIEGEFVHVAAPKAGAIERTTVERGGHVQAGDLLFVLESALETAAVEEAKRRVAQARARFDDVRKGQRPSEITSIEARIRESEAALEFARKELDRQQRLIGTPGATTQQDLERARAAQEQARQRVAQLQADLETARLGSRPDLVAAEEASLRALEAALTQAEWHLAERKQSAPESGRVFDVLYRTGEWVAAGRPVVTLLPPAGVKLRVYVPQAWVGSLKVGDEVNVRVDGIARPFIGRISFISPQAEFTPPIIYSRETRQKFVYLVEAAFAPDAAAQLHPGQPVDVRFNLPRSNE